LFFEKRVVFLDLFLIPDCDLFKRGLTIFEVHVFVEKLRALDHPAHHEVDGQKEQAELDCELDVEVSAEL